jgi:hypothetical protein
MSIETDSSEAQKLRPDSGWLGGSNLVARLYVKRCLRSFFR